MRTAPKSSKSIISQRRMGPYTLLSMVWKGVFCSLLLDLLLLMRTESAFRIESSTELSAMCAFTVLPFLNQNRISQSLVRLRNLQQAKKHLVAGATKFIIVAFCFLLVLLKLLNINYFVSIKGIIFASFIVCWGGLLLYHNLKSHRRRYDQSHENNLFQILAWERQIVFLNLIPIFMARGVSLIPSIGSSVSDISISTYIQFICSALLLLMLRPIHKYYIGHCPSCRRIVPVAFVNHGKCLSCDDSLYS